ncbi:MAG: lactate utilization protein B/C, partial [Sphingobacteriales bacterium]
FVYCDNEQELLEGLAGLFDSQGWTQLLCTEKDIIAKAQALGINLITPADASLDKADACITGCESLIARTGSVILSSKQPMGRIGPVFFPVHIIVAYSNQVVDDIGDGLDQIHSKYGAAMPSLINLNTGPSRTADIEKTLVVGVHGPKEVFCFLVNRQ